MVSPTPALPHPSGPSIDATRLKWEKAMVITTIVQTVAVFLSLVFIVHQLRQQTMLSRAANTQSLATQITPLNLKTAEPESAALWLRKHDGIENGQQRELKEIQLLQYHSLLSSYLIFYENAFLQHQQKLLDDEIFHGWTNDLRSFVAYHELERYWSQWRGSYHPKFAAFIDSIIHDPKKAAATN